MAKGIAAVSPGKGLLVMNLNLAEVYGIAGRIDYEIALAQVVARQTVKEGYPFSIVCPIRSRLVCR